VVDIEKKASIVSNFGLMHQAMHDDVRHVVSCLFIKTHSLHDFWQHLAVITTAAHELRKARSVYNTIWQENSKGF
jgi:hypothetical protein